MPQVVLAGPPDNRNPSRNPSRNNSSVRDTVRNLATSRGTSGDAQNPISNKPLAIPRKPSFPGRPIGDNPIGTKPNLGGARGALLQSMMPSFSPMPLPTATPIAPIENTSAPPLQAAPSMGAPIQSPPIANSMGGLGGLDQGFLQSLFANPDFLRMIFSSMGGSRNMGGSSMGGAVSPLMAPAG